MATAHPIPSNPRFINLVGNDYGKWHVDSYAGTRGPTHYFNCTCACGRQKEVAGESLKRGLSICCRTCAHRVPMKKHITHGASHSITYSSWKAMIARCTNRKANGYHRYGGRGIGVCQRWIDSFADFLSDVGERPSLAYSIERIDNDGNYEKANCRWATWKEQMSNTRRSLKNKRESASFLK